MTERTRTFTCVGDGLASQRDSDNLAMGAGLDAHLPIGRSRGFITRSFAKFNPDHKGAIQIKKAVLRGKTTSAHVTTGSSPRILLQRCTQGFTPGTAGKGESNWLTSNALKWPGPGRTSTDQADKVMPESDGVVFEADITAIWEDSAPKEVKRRNGTPCGGLGAATGYAIALVSFDEGSTARACEISSIEGIYKLTVILTFEDNRPPNAPGNVTPKTGDGNAPAIVASTSGTELTVASTFSDPDAGAKFTKYQIQVLASNATDAVPGSARKDTGAIATGISGNAMRYTITGLAPRTAYRFRIRHQDEKGAWGPWSPLANGLIQTAYKPKPPQNPVVQDDTLDPDFFGSISSGDKNDFWTGVEVEVDFTPTAGSTILKWDSGQVPIGGSTTTRFQIGYGGTGLRVGEKYRGRMRGWNRDGVPSDWTPFFFWSPRDVTGPTITPRDVNTKFNTLQPSYTIADSQPFDGIQWWWYSKSDGTGTLLHDSGLLTVASTTNLVVTVPAGKGAWGMDPGIKAAVRRTGTGSLAEPSPILPGGHINALPSPPSITVGE